MSTTTQEIPVRLHDASVFVNGKRIFKSLYVEIVDSTIRVKRHDIEIRTFDIVEVVKNGMAFDVMQEGELVRVVVQSGCGCSGMRRYKPDEGYSGALSLR